VRSKNNKKKEKQPNERFQLKKISKKEKNDYEKQKHTSIQAIETFTCSYNQLKLFDYCGFS